jgi:6-phosphogluconolactonase (cycloisomerase 2 family)
LQELLKVLYVDAELTYLKDLDLSGAGSAEKADSSYDGRNGVRSIRISPDGKHLASGDRAGNIRYAFESMGLYANKENGISGCHSCFIVRRSVV